MGTLGKWQFWRFSRKWQIFARGLAIQFGGQKCSLGEWRFLRNWRLWRTWQNLAKMANMAQWQKISRPEGWRYQERGRYSNWVPSGPLKLDD